MYLQIRLVRFCCSSVHTARKQSALARVLERAGGAIWPKAAAIGRAAGTAARTEEEQKKRDPKLLRQG